MVGDDVLAKISALRDDPDEEEIPSTLVAAVYAEALRQDEPPRVVADCLWKSLPTDKEWELDMAAAKIIAACDALED